MSQEFDTPPLDQTCFKKILPQVVKKVIEVMQTLVLSIVTEIGTNKKVV